jgi:hypothetical protein
MTSARQRLERAVLERGFRFQRQIAESSWALWAVKDGEYFVYPIEDTKL